MKRKLIMEEWLSLDGYVSDKEGKLDFFAKHVRESYTTEQRLELLKSTDTILFGRKTYEAFSKLWPERPVENDILAHKINTLTKLVFSTSLREAPWGKYPSALIASSEPIEKIKELKLFTGKNMVIWGSITLVQSLLANRLIDEFHLHICPVLVGGEENYFKTTTTLQNSLC